MPELSLTESIITSLNAQEPWPDNVKLFQPYEVEQILLPDNASCLAVQAFLKMCNLPFEVEMRWNAEFMSPSGRVPFIKCGAFVVAELESIVQFAANKGVTICSRLSSEERAEMRAYMSLITNVLVNAELYISWLDDETFNAVTRVRNSSVYPWPLGWIQTRSKRSAVIKRLKALHWQEKTLEQVLADVEQCCNSLSQRLGDKDFFFGTPTALDALVYGHVRALLSATGPKASLMIRPITSSLLRHVLRLSNLTQLKLTPQEEYLIAQGCQICSRRRFTERAGSRAKRSKICTRNPSQESVTYNRDVFGFKPFASKQVIILSNDGKMTCQYEYPKENISFDEDHKFLVDIIEEIIDKVDEISNSPNEIRESEFEVIAYPNERFEKMDKKDYLDTIKEYESDAMVSIEMVGDDEIQVIDTVMDNDVYQDVIKSETAIGDTIDNKDLTDSTDNSNNNYTYNSEEGKNTATNLSNESSFTNRDEISAANNEKQAVSRCQSQEINDLNNDNPILSKNCDVLSIKNNDSKTLKDIDKHEIEVASTDIALSRIAMSTESRSSSSFSSDMTLKMPSTEMVNVESLLKFLRERKAMHQYCIDVFDID